MTETGLIKRAADVGGRSRSCYLETGMKSKGSEGREGYIYILFFLSVSWFWVNNVVYRGFEQADFQLGSAIYLFIYLFIYIYLRLYFIKCNFNDVQYCSLFIYFYLLIWWTFTVCPCSLSTVLAVATGYLNLVQLCSVLP